MAGRRPGVSQILRGRPQIRHRPVPQRHHNGAADAGRGREGGLRAGARAVAGRRMRPVAGAMGCAGFRCAAAGWVVRRMLWHNWQFGIIYHPLRLRVDLIWGEMEEGDSQVLV